MKINAVTAAAFKPNTRESKAETTDAAARAIIDAEAARRKAKTARLRDARLAMEAKAAAAAKVAPKVVAKAKLVKAVKAARAAKAQTGAAAR
jgi:hypothetical protein